jgi:hypothetical protein
MRRVDCLKRDGRAYEPQIGVDRDDVGGQDTSEQGTTGPGAGVVRSSQSAGLFRWA